MRILLAEDEAEGRLIVESVLEGQGHEIVVASDGEEAWDILSEEAPPQFLILDRHMPKLDGTEICRRLQPRRGTRPTYVLLLTAMDRISDIVSGLDAGADDYLVKPYNIRELQARVRVGLRILETQQAVANRIEELEAALKKVKRLQGLLPMCAHCKRVRDDDNYWTQVEAYATEHSEAQFTHGICPECTDELMKDGTPKRGT